MTCNVFPPDARMASSGFMSTASIVSLISLARIPKEKTINAKMPGNTPTPNRPTNTTAKTRSGIVRNTFINVRTERYKDFDVVIFRADNKAKGTVSTAATVVAMTAICIVWDNGPQTLETTDVLGGKNFSATCFILLRALLNPPVIWFCVQNMLNK